MLNLDQQNRLREQYRHSHPAWRPAGELYAALARSYLHQDARVLDLGCGRGGLVEQLGHPAQSITGVDPDQNSLTEHRLESLNLAAAMSEALPFRSRSFDIVLASWLFEHLSKPRQTLSQVYRVLKSGGVLLFITPNLRHPIAFLNGLLGYYDELQGVLVKMLYGREPEDAFPTHYLANTVSQLNQLARQTGFEAVTVTTVPDPTYLAFTPALFQLTQWLEDALPDSRNIHLVGVFQRPI